MEKRQDIPAKPSTEKGAVKVLFVCLGNICRSPMAEGLFAHLVAQAGLDEHIHIDSCGTGGWHIGEAPDRRMQQTARRHGIALTSRGRQIAVSDIADFDYILAMDERNYQDVLELAAETAQELRAGIYKMRYFDPEGKNQDVPDPYFGGERGFEEVYALLERSCRTFLTYIQQTHPLR